MKITRISQQTNYKQNFGAISPKIRGSIKELDDIESMIFDQVLKSGDKNCGMLTVDNVGNTDYTVVFTTGKDVYKTLRDPRRNYAGDDFSSSSGVEFLEIPQGEPKQAQDILKQASKKLGNIMEVLFK